MTTPATASHVFDGAAIYQIRVYGRLKAIRSDRLGGMAITVNATDDGGFETTLSGILADQAALAGVLGLLYDLRVAVMSVERCEIPRDLQ